MVLQIIVCVEIALYRHCHCWYLGAQVLFDKKMEEEVSPATDFNGSTLVNFHRNAPQGGLGLWMHQLCCEASFEDNQSTLE